MFSTSDEYETALITERRAQGRYDQRRTPLAAIMFVGCALMVVGTVLLLQLSADRRPLVSGPPPRRLFLFRRPRLETRPFSREGVTP